MPSSLLVKIKSMYDNTGMARFDSAFKGTIGIFKTAGVAIAMFAPEIAGIVTALTLAKKTLIDLPRYLISMGPAAADAEAGFVKLKTQLGLLGLASEENLKRVKEFADQSARSTQFSSEETQAAVTMAVRRTGDVNKAIKQVAVSQNLAYISNRDLLTVTQLLNLAQAGNTRIIRQVTNMRQKDIETAVREGKLIDVLAEKFAGAATKGAGTYIVQLQRLSNINRQIKEELGTTTLWLHKLGNQFLLFGATVQLALVKSFKTSAMSVEGFGATLARELNILKSFKAFPTAGLISFGATLAQVANDAIMDLGKLNGQTKIFTYDFDKQFEIRANKVGKTRDEIRTYLEGVRRAEEILVIANTLGTQVLTKNQLELVNQYEFARKRLGSILSDEVESERILSKERFDNMQKLTQLGKKGADMLGFIESARKSGESIGEVTVALHRMYGISLATAKAIATVFIPVVDTFNSIEKSVTRVQDILAYLNGKYTSMFKETIATTNKEIENFIKTKVQPVLNVKIDMTVPPEAIQAAVKTAVLGLVPGIASALVNSVKRGSQEQKANGPAV